MFNAIFRCYYIKHRTAYNCNDIHCEVINTRQYAKPNAKLCVEFTNVKLLLVLVFHPFIHSPTTIKPTTFREARNVLYNCKAKGDAELASQGGASAQRQYGASEGASSVPGCAQRIINTYIHKDQHTFWTILFWTVIFSFVILFLFLFYYTTTITIIVIIVIIATTNEIILLILLLLLLLLLLLIPLVS